MYWFITDFWEELHAIPVTIKSRGKKGGGVVVWNLGDGITQEYKLSHLAALHQTKAAAELEAAHMNALKIAHKSDQF